VIKPERGIFDILGIGFGPANIALAIALEERGSTSVARFLERRGSPSWFPDMLLDGSDIQNNPLRDFVTPRNPMSRYTFVNYLHSEGRLFDYLNLGLAFPLRKDYARYVEWAARQFDHIVDYASDVASIDLIHAANAAAQPLYRVRTRGGASYSSRSLVIGTGRTPHVPAVFAPVLGETAFHFTEYLRRVRRLNGNRSPCFRRACVVGGSQSAVEITLDLMKRYPECEVTNVMRSYGYRLKDTSPFSEHVYFPEFVDYFYDAPPAGKKRLWETLKYTNYSAADGDVIHELYLRLYEQKLDGAAHVRLMPNRVVEHASTCGDAIRLSMREVHTGAAETMLFDAVILATGFRNLGPGESEEPHPKLLEPIAHLLRFAEGRVDIGRDYRLEGRDDRAIAPIYLNGLCESSHGFGDSGSFSLLSLRSDTIARSLVTRLQHAKPDARPGGRAEPFLATSPALLGDGTGSAAP
jgi:L-ornithine N5-oxygenase